MVTFDINEIRKLGRNDKCWCGSNLKFKRCHKDREHEKLMSLGEKLAFGNNISKRETCYAPENLLSDCNKVIKSHTISKSSALKSIADDSRHVLGHKLNLANFQKNNAQFKLERIGINNASTFKGFCAKHDKLLFSCFEDKPFTGTKEQCTALTYRSIAKEIYAKEEYIKTAKFMRRNADRGKPLFLQIQMQKQIYLYNLCSELALSELYKLKSILEAELSNHSDNSCSFLAIEYANPLPIVVSSITNPTHDFKDKYLQDLASLDEATEQLIFNAFTSNNKGFVVFSWLKKAEVIDKFMNSLLKIDKKDMFSYLVNFCFSSAENTFISPDWWNTLDTEQQQRIEALFKIGLNHTEERPKNVLADNSITFEGWEVENLYRVP